MDNELDTDVKETSETEDKKAPRIPKKLVKKLVIVAGMIIGQFIVAYFLLTTLNVTNLLSSHEEVIPVKVDSSRIKAEEKVSTFLGEEEVVDDTEAGVFSIDDLVINPSDSKVKSFFVVTMVFMIDNKKGLPEIEKREFAIKDRIISLVSRKTVPWLMEVDNREILRHEIKLIANRELTECQVIKVYFTKYVIQ